MCLRQWVFQNCECHSSWQGAWPASFAYLQDSRLLVQPAAGAEAPALGEQPSADAGADAAAPPAGEAGLVGRVAQVGRRIVRSLLHPDDAGAAAAGEGAAHGEGETGDEDQAVGVVAALAEGGETEGEDQAVGVVPAVSEVDEGVVQPGRGQSDESSGQGGQDGHRRLAEVIAEVAAETAQADMGGIQAEAGNQEDALLLAEVVAVEAAPAEDEGYQRDTGDEEEAPAAEALALAETALEGESAAALLADISAQPAADELGGTLVEGADEDEAPAAAEVVEAVVAQEEGHGAGESGLPATADSAAAPEQAGLDASQEGVLDRVAPAVLAEIAATVAELEPGASLEEAAGPIELAQVTAVEVADENAGNAEPDLEEPAAVAEVAAAAIADEDAGAGAAPGAAAAADTSEGDDIVALAAAAEVAADHTSEGARVTQPAETSFDTAHDEGRAQPVPEVAGILEVTLPAVVTSQGATAEDEDLTAAASLAAQDFDNETVGTSEGADRARRVVDDEDLITAAALAVQDFDAAGDIAAEQALITAAVLAAGDFAEADEADERAAKDAAEQALITAAGVAAEEYHGMEDEPGLEDSEGQAGGASRG